MFELRCSEFELGCSESACQPSDCEPDLMPPHAEPPSMKIGFQRKRISIWILSAVFNRLLINHSNIVRIFRSGGRGAVKSRMDFSPKTPPRSAKG